MVWPVTSSGVASRPRRPVQRHGIGNPVPADCQGIDDDGRVDLGIAALGELCCRSVDRAGHSGGVAGQGQGLRIVGRLEDDDSGIGPACRRA